MASTLTSAFTSVSSISTFQATNNANSRSHSTTKAFPLAIRACNSVEEVKESAVNGRRQVTMAGVAALLSIAAGPARADVVETYTEETTKVIEKVRATLALDRDDPSKQDAVNELRDISNSWVSKYRREKQVAGKISFSNMYSVLNAVSGHYTSFGANSVLPKKRATRILEECSDAERALARGR